MSRKPKGYWQRRRKEMNKTRAIQAMFHSETSTKAVRKSLTLDSKQMKTPDTEVKA